MNRSSVFLIVITGLLGVCFPLLAQSSVPEKIEDLFPEEFRTENYSVRRTPLDAEKKAYLKKLGVSQKVIDLYGDLHVKGYDSEHLRWGDLRPYDFGRDKVTFDAKGLVNFPPLKPGKGTQDISERTIRKNN